VINRLLLILTLLSLYQPALAQDSDAQDKDRQYVTDQLRLSLYQEPSSQSKVIKLLQSGDLLIVDEISGPYARVTAPDGARGWVKRGFLVSNPTAKILLQEERQKSANLFEELEKLTNSKVVIDTYEKDMDDLVTKIKNLEADNLEARETITRLELQAAEASQQQESETMELLGEMPSEEVLNSLRAHWKIIVSVLVVVVLLTFLVSKLAIEARIKSRFHGIKFW
jgi:SH3 domain protein